jgi:transposase
VRAIEQAHPEARVERWGQDEHRVGLKPIERRVWSPRGERPVAEAWERYEWTYVWGFVEPASGRTWWLVLPTVNVAVCSLALAEFAAAMELGPDKRIVLLLDNAGWHTGHQLELPEGLHLVFQPAYSPELQPAERLWPLTNEPLANRSFETIEELEEVLVQRCRTLAQQTDQIRALTHYHWWPDAEAEDPSLAL